MLSRAKRRCDPPHSTQPWIKFRVRALSTRDRPTSVPQRAGMPSERKPGGGEVKTTVAVRESARAIFRRTPSLLPVPRPACSSGYLPGGRPRSIRQRGHTGPLSVTLLRAPWGEWRSSTTDARSKAEYCRRARTTSRETGSRLARRRSLHCRSDPPRAQRRS